MSGAGKLKPTNDVFVTMKRYSRSLKNDVVARNKNKGIAIVSVLCFLALVHYLAFSGSKADHHRLGTTSSLILLSQDINNGRACPTEGSFAPKKPIVVTKAAVLAHGPELIDTVKDFTVITYSGYMSKPPGTEHYRLLSYLTKEYGDCRHIVDIGTRVVASSLALAASGTPVWTFDLPTSRERVDAFRGKTEVEWQSQVKQAGVDITFHNLDLIAVSEVEFGRFMSTWLVMLDTHHLPFTVPFEREFMTRLVGIKFKGIVLLDDIHLNPEMEKWWKELQDNASKDGYTCYDLTSVGHHSGTGLLDFTGNAKVEM